MANKFYSATDLCTLLGITKQTLWRWEHDERVNLPKPARIRGQRFFPVDEIEQFISDARG